MPPIFEKYLGFSEPKPLRRRYASQDVTKFTLTPTAVFYTLTEEEIRREIYARERKPYTSGFQPLSSLDSALKRELPLGVLSAGLLADFDDMPRFAWLLPTSKKKLRSPRTEEGTSAPMLCSFPTSKDQMYIETLKEFPIMEPTECLFVLDQWMADCVKEAEERALQEVSDENAAHTLQTKILGPREARIREDVADVRKFELEQHRDRMLRHRIAIEEAIEEDKQKLPILKSILQSLETKIRHMFNQEAVSLSSHSNTEM
ncbi:unnamed protein product [Dibothriocephalus latus]|uniref:Uncharacterized protein n=1 Tax=Dibothriocephalus latus TaxID=60516 RepID=A0A3P7LAQ3_DIBLA|nr:unnamed protein product [Dibothriocephalus latus]